MQKAISEGIFAQLSGGLLISSGTTSGIIQAPRRRLLVLPSFKPMRLAHLRQPFDHADWVFELKYDGFRALAYVENGSARVVSRRHNAYRSFNTLCAQIAQCLKVENAILDGEIVCLGKDGRPRFYDLLRRRSPQYFYAFDLLWLNGRDLRELALIERKRLLRRIIPKKRSAVLFAKHVESTGVALFHAACEMDLEGIVAKWKSAPYRIWLPNELGKD